MNDRTAQGPRKHVCILRKARSGISERWSALRGRRLRPALPPTILGLPEYLATHVQAARHKALAWCSRFGQERILPSCGKAQVPLAVAAVIVAHVVLAWVLRRASPTLVGCNGDWLDYVSSLWQVEAGVLGITLVVIVMILERHTGTYLTKDLYRYYLRDSRMVPILVGALAQVGCTGFTTYSMHRVDWRGAWVCGLFVANCVMFLVFLLANLWLYQKSITYMDPESRSRVREAVLKQAMQKSVAEHTRVLTNRNAVRNACRQVPILWRTSTRIGSDWCPVRCTVPETRWIASIDSCLLKETVSKMARPLLSGPRSDMTYKAVLAVEVGEVIGPGKDTVLYIHPDEASDQVVRRLRRAFGVSPNPPINDAALADALDLLAEETSVAIRDRRAGETSLLFHTYTDLVGKTLARWDDGLQTLDPLQRADAAPMSVLEPPRPLYRILNGACSAAVTALCSGDTELARSALACIFDSCVLAFDHDQSCAFHLSSRALVDAYRAMHGRGQELSRRSGLWGALTCIARTIAIPLRESVLTPADIAKRREYLLRVIATFEALLKAAVDASDADSFAAAGDDLEALGGDLRLPGLENDIADLRDQLVPVEEPGQLEDQIAVLEAKRDALAAVFGRTDALWFGLSAWIVRQLRETGAGQEAACRMLDYGRHKLSDLGRLYGVYIRSQETGAKDLPWLDWVLDARPAFTARRTDTTSWPRFFYCMQGLRLVQGLRPGQNPIISHPLLNLEIRHLEQTCEEISDSRRELAGLVTDGDLAHIDEFIALHRSAAHPPAPQPQG